MSICQMSTPSALVCLRLAHQGWGSWLPGLLTRFADPILRYINRDSLQKRQVFDLLRQSN